MVERITNGNFTTDMNGWTQVHTPAASTFLQRNVDYYGVPFVMMQNFSGSASSDVSISQTVNFTDCHYLTFQADNESWDTPARGLTVFVDGVAIFTVPYDSYGWPTYSVPVSYSGNHTLAFKCVYDDWGTTCKIRAISMESNPAPPAPVAQFEGFPTSGDRPLTVLFTDESTNSPTSWLWDFGDGHLSAEKNPMHIYTVAGVYTVSLLATNAGGNDMETKSGYISVIEPPPPPPYVEPIWSFKIGPT